ncbi:MAG: ribosome-associated translation inhibitor RaiA [Betaproteobacteria bacterium]|nr:ribosome-associated translation inhibitor RaiA [Betaproteobacteria bacterium]MBV9362351.1 ribosome-associated translation inhibitor RaiA [Betaproteobacteria bacterium]
MFLPLQITLRNVPRSDELDQIIRQHAERLQHFDQRLVSCRVVVERVGHQTPQFTVRIDLKTPGSEIAVDRQHNDDVHAAIRDGFDAARRQLEDRVRLRRGDVKAHP